MRRRLTITLACWTAAAALAPACAGAAAFDEVLEGIARATKRAEKLPSGQRIFRRGGDLPELRLPKTPEDELLRKFNRLEGVDDSLRKSFQRLPPAQRAAVVELGEAAQKILRRQNRSADEAVELLRKLDTDGLAQVRTYGDFVAEGVEKMGPEYKGVVRKMGAGAGKFYQDWIRPHWGKITAAGLVAAYLAAPETFHDAAGGLTKHGTEQFTKAGIIVGRSFLEGIWEGLKEPFLEKPFASTCGLALILAGLLMLVPRVRWLVWRRGLRRLVMAPTETAQDRKPVSRRAASPPEHFEE